MQAAGQYKGRIKRLRGGGGKKQEGQSLDTGVIQIKHKSKTAENFASHVAHKEIEEFFARGGTSRSPRKKKGENASLRGR